MSTEPATVPGGASELDRAALEQAVEALREVYDPELGLDIVSMGLVYALRVEGDDLVLEMTLTTPGCPVSEGLPCEAGDAVAGVLGLRRERVDVRVVWDPPWTLDRLDPMARNVLGLG